MEESSGNSVCIGQLSVDVCVTRQTHKALISLRLKSLCYRIRYRLLHPCQGNAAVMATGFVEGGSGVRTVLITVLLVVGETD